MKKKLMIIDREQFGSLTDTMKYCEHLHSVYKITYISFDKGIDKVIIPDIKNIYVSSNGNKIIRSIRFLLTSLKHCFWYNGVIFIVYFPKSIILKRILFWKKMHIDIRTLSVDKSLDKQEIENKEIEKTINSFDSISFISEGIRKKITINKNIPTYILPLGADIISDRNKSFNSLKLLYIGALYNRNILDTIIGVKKFIDLHPNIEITYSIVGDGEELLKIKEYISQNKLKDKVKTYGKIPYNRLKFFLDNHNVGISYIPIIDCYQYQPPTKTFEYGLSGLYVLATKTYANELVINKSNGILINDNPNDFSDALYYIYLNRNNIRSQEIRDSMKDYQWEEIIKKYLIPILSQ